VRLDRLHRDEERLRDLLVRQPFRSQLGDALLHRRQSASGMRPAGVDPRQLGAGLLDPAGRSDLGERRDRSLE